ncbi:MerR family transcriptional regulator [Jannaschia sp. CCS1]|uniref:MerR family transcriptional regulator n=1 Tax=Jannaschia sp. (strain CCS1) TaxID=290400 RepID=UPI00006C0057|nr:MerR family transcriptional regulator [Jannaschia sp. CCS1]ABD55428.1 transcriptional regulator, MerR family [Jannaschia sp. CCS1]
MQISEVSERSGLSVATIRYYERAGICPKIPRDGAGHRVFTPEMLAWLTLLAALRDTGMGTEKMTAFAMLYRDGDATVAARKRMLMEHQTALAAQQARLDACQALLAQKLTRYDEILGDG